jgi:asparagine synthase (glutamine-hydrolysing)
MCGIAGMFDLRDAGRVDSRVMCDMLRTLVHRGPDDTGTYAVPNLACGTTRLAIVDQAGGRQPLLSEDESVVLVFNGEIFNHRELRDRLIAAGHRPRTQSDGEVLIHLYEDCRSAGFLKELNGQFAFVLYDRHRHQLLAARDQFGICPLYYAIIDGVLAFASEIKALLEYPALPRTIDVRALDQVFSLPGIISPRTILEHVSSLQPGHVLLAGDGAIRVEPYWDLTFPAGDAGHTNGAEPDMIARVTSLLDDSVRRRLLGEAPIGVYLSGGLDSSLIAASLRAVLPDAELHAFSIAVEADGFSERAHQDVVARALGLTHHVMTFRPGEIGDRLKQVIYHCECPIKELHNTGALALSEFARSGGMKVILSGQGADELFAGYIGYRFDAFRRPGPPLDLVERSIRRTLWDDEEFFYEKDQAAFLPIKRRVYSARLKNALGDLGGLDRPVIPPGRLKGLHPIHKRSYVDCKIRLGEHLLADHGDRMCLANALEVRHPFLDRDFVDFATRLPVDMKLRKYEEKYALKRVAEQRLPAEILARDKFGFAVPGTPALIREGRADIEALLAPECIAAQGYFDPDEVGRLVERYRTPGFDVQVPFEDDLLAPVITFGLLLQVFDLSSL